MRTAAFTIVSLNYAAFAKTLMELILSTHPEWDRHVLLVDKCDEKEGFGGDLFTTTTVEQLPLPRMQEFLFRYGIMELNTAVKPYMFSQLRRQGYERVIYLDPDILVIDRLVDVERLLAEGATGVVTPHLTAPLDDGRLPSELDILRAGAYNLGFLALGSLPASDAFVTWWEAKLEYGAVSDPLRGLFTDQRWVDLAPGMFGGFAILRDPGYNVAYWNLPNRPVTHNANTWLAGDRPLRFFHFSGFSPLNPQPFSKHQDRLTLSTIGQAQELALDYAARLLRNGYAEFAKQPYAFGSFTDGTPIPSAIRALYRADSNVRSKTRNDPFNNAGFFVFGEVGGLPTILRALWLEQAHLQRAFPDPLGSNRLAYFKWFVEAGGVESGIPEAFILPIRRALSTLPEPNVDNSRLRTKASMWARALVSIHKRITGGLLSLERQAQYHEVTGPFEFLRLGFEQFLGSRWAKRLGLGRTTSARLDPLAAAVSHSANPPAFCGRNRVRFSGMYVEPGKEAWWVGRQARFIVDHAETRLVRLRGVHHGDLHQRAHGKTSLTIYVGFNDEPGRDITVQAGPFDVSIDLEKLPNRWPAELYVLPEASVVPKELGLNDDVRRLSVQLTDISIGATPVFDTAQRNAFHNSVSMAVPAVNVIGYARSEHGVGQSLRQFTTALDAIDIPYVVIDFNVNNNSRVEDHSVDERITEEPAHKINVFHINADQMPEAGMHFPSYFFSRYNIGFWHWELPDMLEEHLSGFSNLNEVWVPTGFVQDAVSKRSPVPVVRMPHAIDFTISQGARRARFGLPDDKFLFLMMYDFSSYQERKNPQAAVDAFDQAFAKDGNKVTLIIKTQNAQFHEADVAILRDRLAGRHDVIWINETLTRQQIYDLQSVCDAFVSLHRSEGYGLGPAEAMFLGKPVIATNWSGNTEFMRPQNSLLVNYTLVKIEKDFGAYKAGQTWANPDVAHAATLMRQIVEDEELRLRISAEARRTMHDEFSPHAIGQKIRARLTYIQSELM